MSTVCARAPGRVNLIGEHTDYNGGFVLPCAIGYHTTVRARRRADTIVDIDSAFGSTSFASDAVPSEHRGDWTDYVRGVAIELRDRNIDVQGSNLDIESTVPPGAGLSSSAALEVSVALAFLALAGSELPKRDIALLTQQAERRYAGVMCGIMDQFTVLHGRAGHALLLDTRSLEYHEVPVPQQAAVVICNTMVRHRLAGGEYNTRRAECAQSVERLRRMKADIEDLRDIVPADLEAAARELPETLFRRVRHVVTENDRVQHAARALRAGDLRSVGALMNASHESLRDDYEVSCPELDLMVDLARNNGAIGARMTGGGFGGCTVNIVPREHSAEFREAIVDGYRNATGMTAEIYDGTPADGAAVERDG